MQSLQNYDHITEARKLIKSTNFGILSTHSHSQEGYPFGSLTPYVEDKDGNLIILISHLAEHTKNILNDNKVSITIVEENDDYNPQTRARLTYLGNARKVKEDEKEYTSNIYLAFFPYAGAYFSTHNFEFYIIEPTRIRFIGGFGKIFWIEPEEIQGINYSNEIQDSIIKHMNEDHMTSLVKYFNKYKNIEVTKNDDLKMISIDDLGFHILRNKEIHRFQFYNKLSSPSDIRSAFVEL